MALPAFLLPSAVSIIKAGINFFKNKGKHDKANRLEQAVNTIHELMTDAETDQELKKLIIQKEIEFEKDYTERVKASLDVIKVETQSEDPYVRRARPTWLYASVVIFGVIFCIFPIVKIKVSDYIPTDILSLFLKATITGFLGYGVFRTIDKKNINFKKIIGR